MFDSTPPEFQSPNSEKRLHFSSPFDCGPRTPKNPKFRARMFLRCQLKRTHSIIDICKEHMHDSDWRNQRQKWVSKSWGGGAVIPCKPGEGSCGFGGAINPFFFYFPHPTYLTPFPQQLLTKDVCACGPQHGADRLLRSPPSVVCTRVGGSPLFPLTSPLLTG